MAQDQLTIIFDLDGTLIDVSARHHKVYEDTVMEFGGEPLNKDQYWELKRAKTKWPEMLVLSKIDIGNHENFMESFISKIESPYYLKLDKVLPGVFNVLDKFSNENRCFLLSLRRNQDNLIDELNNLGLHKFFQKIISGHTEGKGFELKIKLMKQIIKAKEKTLIVGDTEADILAAKELNIKSVAVLSGIRDKKSLLSIEPDLIIDNVNDLGKYIEEILSQAG